MSSVRGLLLVLFLLPLGVVADSGVREIHGLCVADGCFAGDLPGFPVEITEPGVYALRSNLELPVDTTAILVTASDVQLDLGGFSILGPVACSGDEPTCSPSSSGDGVYAEGGTNLVVSNGTIRGMGRSGIYAFSYADVHLRDLRIRDIGANAILANQGANIIDSVAVRDVFTTGASVGFSTIVRNSTFINTGGLGVSAGHCIGNLFNSNSDRISGPEENCARLVSDNYCAGSPC